MSTRRVIFGILTLTALAVPTTALTSAGAASSGTSCTFEHDVVASPGVSTSPSSGSVNGIERGSTITCNGPVNGKQPTAAGTLGFEGRYGTKDTDTCQGGGEGDGVQTITIPTSDGAEQIRNTVAFSYGAFKAAGAPFSATYDAKPAA